MIEFIAIAGAVMLGTWAGKRHKPPPERLEVSTHTQSNLHYLTELNNALDKVRGVKAASSMAWEFGRRSFTIQEKDGLNVKSEFEFTTEPKEEIVKLLYLICCLHEHRLIREIRHTLDHIDGLGGIKRTSIVDGGFFEKPTFIPHIWRKERN